MTERLNGLAEKPFPWAENSQKLGTNEIESSAEETGDHDFAFAAHGPAFDVTSDRSGARVGRCPSLTIAGPKG